MPGLVKKLLVFAAVDGILLQPASSTSGGVKIEYGSNNNRITSASSPNLNKKDDGRGEGLEVHGIIGLLNLVSSSYLISITHREQVATICKKPVFKITDVLLIPLKSRQEAEGVIGAAVTRKSGKDELEGDVEDSDDVGDEAETSSIGTVETEKAEEQAEEALEVPKVRGGVTSFVKNVVQDKGNYGRFATRWFSKNGSQEVARRQVGLSPQDKKEDKGTNSELTREQSRQMGEALPADEGQDTAEKEQKEDVNEQHTAEKQQSAIEYLTPRIVRNARLYFSNSGFYFSYEHDMSTSLGRKGPSATSVPLWKRFDDLFFWNRNLMGPFIEAGQDNVILPLMQGFVGQRAFSIAKTGANENDVVEEKDPDSLELMEMHTGENKTSSEPDEQRDFLLTLISRRSIRRAGLRYLRRGVDDDGAVANSVETEQILSPQDWNESAKAVSLLQIRGSIPLFFSQSPYSFKPLPVMFGSEATNQAAFRKHFQAISKRYGIVQCASLVDKKAPEITIGERYEQHAKLLNGAGGIDGKQVGFEWFDFHHACKGMRFENVQILMDTLQEQLNNFGWIERQGDKTVRQQTGVLRTNCMDCLDRTNVVQSAVAGWTLQQQLAELNLDIDLKTDMKTQWFNTLWADNGDAISKQYAGTSALKGDFTRTRKRNWTGALSDFSLTLNRYYNNIFGDYFLQTNIDYYLGNASPSVFEDFETDMMSQDYALDMRSIRQNAIDTCINIVLEDPHEDLVAGWTLSCPNQSNTLRTFPFEECVLLLTDKALYFCRFDWDTEKVGSFERVELLDIKEMWRGAYITSALGGTHLDGTKNVGFALKYDSTGPSTVRTNTRSLSVAEGMEQANDHVDNDRGQVAKATVKESATRLLAFKALPAKAVAAKEEDDRVDVKGMSEAELMKHVCEEIHRCITKARGFQHVDLGSTPEVQERDVISIAEAKKSTGYVESLGYSLKKLVWS